MYTSMMTLSLLQGITTFALNSVVQLWNAKVIVQCRKGGGEVYPNHEDYEHNTNQQNIMEIIHYKSIQEFFYHRHHCHYRHD